MSARRGSYFRCPAFRARSALAANLGDGGQSLVELALAAPLFVAFIIASASILQAVQMKAVVTRLASEGARIAVYRGAAGRSEIEAILRRALTGVDSTKDARRLRVQVSDVPRTEAGLVQKVGKPIKVIVTYDLPLPLLGGLIGGRTIPIESVVIVEKWPNAVWFDVK